MLGEEQSNNGPQRKRNEAEMGEREDDNEQGAFD